MTDDASGWRLICRTLAKLGHFVGFSSACSLRRSQTAGTVLIVRAEPADVAALFFGGTLVIEGDEAGEEIVTRSVGVSPTFFHSECGRDAHAP